LAIVSGGGGGGPWPRGPAVRETLATAEAGCWLLAAGLVQNLGMRPRLRTVVLPYGYAGPPGDWIEWARVR